MSNISIRPRFLFFGAHEQIIFFKRLALYLRTGTPLLTALTRIHEGAHTASSSHISIAILEHVRAGHSLSSSLDTFPKLFPPFVSSLVHTGEESGHLPETLTQITKMLEKQQELMQKVRSALIYPTIVVVATLAITVFLTTYAFPKIIPLFRGFKTTLPLTTRMLIAISDFFIHYGLWVGAGLMGAGILLALYRKAPLVKRVYEYLSINVPVVGDLVRAHHLASISRTLATLLSGGSTIVHSLELASTASPRGDVRQALSYAQEQVSSGGRVSDALAHSTIFPTIWIHLLATGEATGTLSENLTTLADMAEQELDEKSRLLATLIEPILMLIMGLMVGFIALAIITPLYQITQDIHIH